MSAGSDVSTTVKHYFCVGCPRSGTTLLQAMLARHPKVFSPPETHFFRKICSHRSWVHRVLGAVPFRTSRRALRQLLKLLDCPELRSEVPRLRLSYKRNGQAFAQILNYVARDQGADMWVEKTPTHLHFIREILLGVPEARFIHLLRDGRDVVASFFEACLNDQRTWVHQVLPRYWENRITDKNGRHRLIDAIVERWNSDIGVSLDHSGDPRHLLLTYADLVQDASNQLKRLCEFMSIEYGSEMLNHRESAESLVGSGDTRQWMPRVFEPLQDTHLITNQSRK